jgi:phosphatidylserine/phosphatidylglycerophosphate/cardiolipin synthase-like enzyme
MVKVQGPVVADWETLFCENWQRWSSVPVRTLEALPATAGDQTGRLTTNQHRRPTEVKSSLLKHIRAAERRVWLATAYFIPSWKIRRALRQAASAGIDVRLLLPGPYCDHPAVRHAGRRFYGRLLRHGVRIYEYQPSFLHAKVILCDQWCAVGSSNIDRWNLRWNLEANQEIDDRAFADQLTEMFEKDFTESLELDDESWRRRPWYLRLLERFWGGVDLWLEREGQRRRPGE